MILNSVITGDASDFTVGITYYSVLSQVTVSEPDFVDDPAAVATLAVLRSKGGEGAVTLVWQLEGQAKDDLSPFNGTLVFTEVQYKGGGVIVPPHSTVLFLCNDLVCV